MKTSDVVIVGSGPAGMTAASYLSRANIETLIIEKGIYGGQMNNTADIENYPGVGKIGGMELSTSMYNDMDSFGVQYLYGKVESLSFDKLSKKWNIKLFDDENISAKAVILATGSESKKLNIPGEEKYRGKGVSYCAVCDGSFFKEKNVVVVGGGDSALEEAYYLSRIVSTVTIIHRGKSFSGQANLIELVRNTPNINFKMQTIVEEINNDKKSDVVHSVTLTTNNRNKNFKTDAIFIYIGQLPNTEEYRNLNIFDSHGWVQTDELMTTSEKGLFAIGDVRQKKLRQITTAVGDGANVMKSVEEYLQEY